MTSLKQIFINNIILLNNTFNTRTIGGLKTIDGLMVKSNILFRSDGLNNIDSADIKILESLNIKRLVDFRSENEVNKNPDIIWNDNIEYIHMPITSDKKINDEIHLVIENKINKNLKDYLIEENKNFILNYTNLYSNFIKSFIKCNGKKTIFHCTAGKDRTGLASMLILYIIGVPMEDILKEYMFSNYCIERTIEKQMIKVCNIFNISIDNGNKILPLLKVDINYINSAIKTINEEYGNIDNYVKTGLKISNDEVVTLKSILCE